MHSDRRSCIYHGSCLPLKQHAHLTSPSHACHGTGVRNPDMPSGEPATLICRVLPWQRAWCTFGFSHSPCTLLLDLLSAARQTRNYTASSSATLIPNPKSPAMPAARNQPALAATLPYTVVKPAPTGRPKATMGPAKAEYDKLLMVTLALSVRAHAWNSCTRCGFRSPAVSEARLGEDCVSHERQD